MSASAIVMMCIACVGLWGGCAVSLAFMLKKKKQNADKQIQTLIIKTAESVLGSAVCRNSDFGAVFYS